MKPLILILFPFSIIFGQTDCEIPERKQWINPYPNCKQVQGNFKIQFFSTRRELTKTPSFPFYTKSDNCLTRYYFGDSTKTFSYCQVMDSLSKIQLEFPDAFPIQVQENLELKTENKKENKDYIVYRTVLKMNSVPVSASLSSFWSELKPEDRIKIEMNFYLSDENLNLNSPEVQKSRVELIGTNRFWEGTTETLWIHLNRFPELEEIYFQF